MCEGLIGRTVINNDDFKLAVRLIKSTVEGPAHEALAIKYGDDDRDQHLYQFRVHPHIERTQHLPTNAFSRRGASALRGRVELLHGLKLLEANFRP